MRRAASSRLGFAGARHGAYFYASKLFRKCGNFDISATICLLRTHNRDERSYFGDFAPIIGTIMPISGIPAAEVVKRDLHEIISARLYFVFEEDMAAVIVPLRA